MGLCKCPKRKVTNLFCFEHRVNVCEHCLVANHAKVGRLEQCLKGGWPDKIGYFQIHEGPYARL